MESIINLKNRMKFWFVAARYHSLPQTIVPYIFAVILASKGYDIDYFLGFLGLVGVIFAHLGINLLDDYFDWKKGAVAARKLLIDGGMRARSHKCFYLEDNSTTEEDVLTIALGMCAFATSLGLIIAYNTGISVLVIAAITGILGFFYAAPPFRLSYHGLGEIVVGIIFGPLLMSGAYIAAGGEIDDLIIFASLIVGLLVVNILHTHAIMDFEPDKAANRISFAVLLKSQKNAINAQIVMLTLVYVITVFGVLTEIFPLISLFTLITIPKAVALVKLMKNEDNTKKFWMGPMEKWENFKKQGLDWFMLRWYLSRNLLTDFVVILAITNFIG